MILEFQKPIPVVTPLGDGYAIYVTSSGMFENDVWTVALEKSGDVKHFTTDHIKIYQNLTFDIRK
jgi:hypothetical protein